jgi:hypothetical protein
MRSFYGIEGGASAQSSNVLETAMRKLLIGSVAMIGLALSGAAHAANLIVNGSFEDTTNFVANSGNDTMILCPASASPCAYSPGSPTSITGWTVIGASGSELAWIGPTNPYSGAASYAPDGSYFLDLTGYNNGAPFGGVSQVINTTPGRAYVLAFDLGDNQAYNGDYTQDAITATASSTSQTFYSDIGVPNGGAPDDWVNETMDFIATGSQTTVSLIGAQGWAFIGLDCVSVSAVSDTSPSACATSGSSPGSTPVPEAPSTALLVSGLAAMVLVRRKARGGGVFAKDPS